MLPNKIWTVWSWIERFKCTFYQIHIFICTFRLPDLQIRRPTSVKHEQQIQTLISVDKLWHFRRKWNVSASVKRKYVSTGLENLKQLKNRGCTILHGVDAHTMRDHPSLQHKLFDRIVFNFPHGRFVWPEHMSRQIK